MKCEDVELELLGEPSVEARAHLEACASCQQTAKLLGLAALPPMSEAERLQLNGLRVSTEQALRAQQGRGELLRRGGSLAFAAGLGALLTSAVLAGPAAPPPTPAPAPVVETVALAVPELPWVDEEPANLSDDEVFFDVGWPSPTEGEP